MDKDFLNRMYERQEKMAEDINDIKTILSRQEEQLKLHIYRTDLAEQNIEMLRTEFKTEITPVKTHTQFVNALMKLVGGIAIIVGLIAGIVELIKFFN